ncbi:MAG: glycosyltransferase family 87 protein [Propionibacteriaceae bacterium]
MTLAGSTGVGSGRLTDLDAGLGSGRHAIGGPPLLRPALVVVLVATAVYLIGIWEHAACRVTRVGQHVDQFAQLCYTDIPLLYRGRGLVLGNTPYLDSGNYPVLEYPVLTGWFLEFERLVTVALGAPSGAALSEQQQLTASVTFYDVNTVLLFVLFLIAVMAQLRTVEGRPGDALLLAASPCVAATALINWDLLPVALTAVGFACWSRHKPTAAGIFWGLGMAAKLYPVFFLGPLVLLCLRSRRMREFGTMIAGFAVAWLVVNLPVIVLAPDAWLDFWRFNSDRSGDLGSLWYVLSLAGHEVPSINVVALLIFAALCVLIAFLCLGAPVRPRFGSVAFLVLAAFLVTNKVYSPQYVLWLLPLLVLARPRWREWVIFTGGELAYWAAIWGHLGGTLSPGNGSADRIYWLAVIVRLATESWVAMTVVRDVLRPAHDPLRPPDLDPDAPADPTGGVLDGAPDAFARRREDALVTTPAP